MTKNQLDKQARKAVPEAREQAPEARAAHEQVHEQARAEQKEVRAAHKQSCKADKQVRNYTRREFLSTPAKASIAGAALAGLGAASLTLSACGDNSASNTSAETLTVKNEQVTTLDAYTEIKKPKQYYKVTDVVKIDGEAILFSSDGVVAAVLQAGKTASPLNTVSLLNLQTSTLTPVLEKPVSFDDGFEIFEIRSSKSLIMWVESNYLTSAWRVYVAKVSSGGLSIGSPNLVDEGDAEYDAPELAVVGSKAYWIVQPAESGTKTKEDSYLKTTSGTGANVVITSHGRFCGGLSVNGKILTAMPRADAGSGVHYQLSAIKGGSVIDSVVLPRAYKPCVAIYLNDGFSFGISASYDYGDGISNVGTYYQIDQDSWLRLIRQPVTVAGTCNGWLFSKTGARTVFVDIDKKAYFTVNPPDNCTEYGDYSVQFGDVEALYNFATITKLGKNNKTSKHVLVRKITLEKA